MLLNFEKGEKIRSVERLNKKLETENKILKIFEDVFNIVLE